jgi:hypothetical protein
VYSIVKICSSIHHFGNIYTFNAPECLLLTFCIPPLALPRSTLVVQARAVLRGHRSDGVVGVRVGPDDVERAVRVCRGVGVTKGLNDVGQGIVLPADEDVAGAGVAVDGVGNAVLIIAAAVCAKYLISMGMINLENRS